MPLANSSRTPQQIVCWWSQGGNVRVVPCKLPDNFLIVPNLEYFFGEVRNQENCLDIIETFSFKNIAEIYLTRLGAIGLRFFESGPLCSILRLETCGSGMVPDYVMKNHDQVVELQGRRLVFANFIAGALFGRISALSHTALSGAQYAGMDEIVGFAPAGTHLIIEGSKRAHAVIAPKTRLAREQPSRVQIVPPDRIAEAAAFMDHIAEREDEFEQANLRACMVMNYQAAILHNEQHAAASLALNFAVAEALVSEIIVAYGLAGERSPKAFATRPQTGERITEAQLSGWPVVKKIDRLKKGGLIDNYLYQRLDEARGLRNRLMHSAAAVTVRQSGDMQTFVRDLWEYLLDKPFELVTAWSMRI
jgi:hypothetical protein